MKKLLLLLTLLLWLPMAQANEAEYQKGVVAYESKDYKTAFTILEPLAEQGYVKAQYVLGRLYEDGRGTPKNNTYAYMWFRIVTADEGAWANKNRKKVGKRIKNLTKRMSYEVLTKAQALATKCWNSKFQDCPETDFAKWQSLAAQGDAEAQYKIAQWYSEGDKIPKNNIYAYMWFSIADANGSDYAEGKIKELAEDMSSEEVTKAQSLAVKCWDSKYQVCSETAQAKIAFAKWQSLAAQGDAEAQYNLGDMYYKGEGVPQHYIYSHMWLSFAKAKDHEEAQKLIEDLTKKMSSEDIAKAETLAVKCWVSEYKDCSE